MTDQPAPAEAAVLVGGVNGLSVVSLAVGATYFVIGFSLALAGAGPYYWLLVFPLVAVIAGHVARRQTKRTGQRGGRIATAGLIVGYLTLALVAFSVMLGLVFSHF
jgi:hypothetical protein